MIFQIKYTVNKYFNINQIYIKISGNVQLTVTNKFKYITKSSLINKKKVYLWQTLLCEVREL